MIERNITDFSSLPPIVAVDFDGTLVEDRFPKIGAEKATMCDAIKRLQKFGVKTILWTSRTGELLEDAINWCEDNGFNFTKINENIDEVQELTGLDTRKVYANVYIDDKNYPADGGAVHNQIYRMCTWLGK